ncbi:hypothetical protein [Pleionea sediminis]|uniref:hypothetical protein n=1 Tax=Pleionea sediminis TaxID=2569479 RepID=UPI0011872864|nr:hypothetical protein [Pleionea sediminis]
MRIMSRLFIYSGLILAFIGILLFTPIADFFPVDLWSNIVQFFSFGEHSNYIKVVATEESHSDNYTLIVVGVSFLLMGYYLKTRDAKNV